MLYSHVTNITINHTISSVHLQWHSYISHQASNFCLNLYDNNSCTNMTRIHKTTWAYNFAFFSVHCYMHYWPWSAVNNIYAPTEAVFVLMKVLDKYYSLLCSLVDGQQHVRETCHIKPLSEDGRRKLFWNIGTNLPN